MCETMCLLKKDNLTMLQTMTDVVGNPEEERRADFYHEPWAQEAVFRYFYGKVGRMIYVKML